MANCLALMTGSLDSMLAVRLMQQQGVAVTGLVFRSPFTRSHPVAEEAAAALAIPLHVITAEDDYLQMLRQPRFGYGRGANPCVDCRIHMLNRAEHLRQELAAEFVISGEIVGQRPMGQKRRHLEIIDYHAATHDRHLRPLCARRLPPTWPERTGLVQRELLGNFNGQNRSALQQLAKQLGIRQPPSAPPQCLLTEPSYGARVLDLLAQHASPPPTALWETISVGRHFRLEGNTTLVLGRNRQENAQLEAWHAQHGTNVCSFLLQPSGFPGPTLLLLGPNCPASLRQAAALVWRYGKFGQRRPDASRERVGCRQGDIETQLEIDPHLSSGAEPF